MYYTCFFPERKNNSRRNSGSLLEEITQDDFTSGRRGASSLNNNDGTEPTIANTQLFFSLRRLPSVIASLAGSLLYRHINSPAMNNLSTLGQDKKSAIMSFFTAEMLQELTLERNKAPCQISKLCLKIFITLGAIATCATYAYKKNYTALHYIWVPALILAIVIPTLYVSCMIHFQHQYLPTIWHKLALDNKVITLDSLINDWQILQDDYTQPAPQLTTAEKIQLKYIICARCVESISIDLIITDIVQALSQSNNKLYEENIQKMQLLTKQKSSMFCGSSRGINTSRLLQDLTKTKNDIAAHYPTAAQSMV